MYGETVRCHIFLRQQKKAVHETRKNQISKLLIIQTSGFISNSSVVSFFLNLYGLVNFLRNLWFISNKFGRFARSYAETVPFHKISTPWNYVKSRYFRHQRAPALFSTGILAGYSHHLKPQHYASISLTCAKPRFWHCRIDVSFSQWIN